MKLTGITVSLISAAMYRSIAEGLIADRVSASQAQARQLAGDAQETLDQTDQTETPAKLSQAVNDIVNSTLAPPADDRSRYFVFARSQNNDEPGPALETRFIKGSGVDLNDIPPELRQAVAADPERQQTTTIDLRRAPPTVQIGWGWTIGPQLGDWAGTYTNWGIGPWVSSLHNCTRLA